MRERGHIKDLGFRKGVFVWGRGRFVGKFLFKGSLKSGNVINGRGCPKSGWKSIFRQISIQRLTEIWKCIEREGESTLWYMKGLAFAIWDDFNPKKLRVFEKYFQLPKISKNEPISFNFIQFLAKFWHFPLISLPLHPNLEIWVPMLLSNY